MRAHDWSQSPLGPPPTWPQSLRTAVSILLNSGHPMFLAWGPELGFIYNDAYAQILGDKHPAALGLRFDHIWADIWDDIHPLVERALGGEATWSEDLYLQMFRRGYWEDTWWTFSYSPIRDESGEVGGMFCACHDTTDRVLGERRLTFQLKVAERLRPLTDPAAIKAAAARLLGEQLGAGRVGFAEMDADQNGLTVENDWAYGELGPLVGRYRLDDFGPAMAATLRQGRLVQVEDVAHDPTTREVAHAYGGLGIAALLAAPLVKDDRMVAVLSVHMAKPHAWTAEEQAMAQELVERTWSSVQRARAETALRDNEERLRLVQAAGGIGSFTWDMVTGQVHRSPEYLALQGLAPDFPQVGRYNDDWLSRVHPEDRARTKAGFDEDLVHGGPFDREYRIVRPSDGQVRWVHNRGRIETDAQGRPVRLLSVQTDVTDRKNDETRQRLLINELNHRVKNTLATVQSIVAQTLRNAASLAEARGALEDRLLALSRTHDILTRRTWEGATVGEIVAGAVNAFGAERWEIDGPEVDLAPNTALSLSLALHELATNAAKYGALASPAGKVSVRWSLEAGPRRLSLVWRERGGPAVTPPTRRGFGSRLIERGLAQDLGGSVALTFEPAGVVCIIEAPLPDDLDAIQD